MTGRQGFNLKGESDNHWKAFGPENHQWKGDAARAETKRARAQRLYELGACAMCGQPATDRHHIDEDTGNNAPDNIMSLCRTCHMTLDGRLARLGHHPREIKPAKKCSHCGIAYKPLRKGLCAACYMYKLKRNVDRPLACNRGKGRQLL